MLLIITQEYEINSYMNRKTKKTLLTHYGQAITGSRKKIKTTILFIMVKNKIINRFRIRVRQLPISITRRISGNHAKETLA